MKKITFLIVCGLLLASFSIRNSYAQTATAGTVDSTFTPGGKVVAQFFGDYYYKLHADSANRGTSQYSNEAKNSNDFQVRRVYLGYNYDISRSFTTEFLLAYEEGLNAAKTTTDGIGERSVYVKYMNLRWKNIYANADAVFGAQATPGFVYTSEKIWGYRSIEKTITDKYGFIKSSDLGIGLQGAFNDDKDYGYDILFADGTGQTPPNIVTQRDKKLYGDLWAKFMDKKIVVQAYGDVMQTQDPSPATNYGKNTSNIKLFAAYATVPLTVGVEAFWQTNTHATIDSNFSTNANDTVSSAPFGISVFVTGQIIENSLNFYARYDSFNPDNNYLTSGIKYVSGPSATISNESFITAGLDYTPYKNVHIMPNIWYSSYSSKLSNATGLAKSDYDLVPRVTFYYKF